MKLLPSCKDITEESSNYLDHHLPLWRRIGFQIHLLMCVHCKRYVDQLKLTIATLGRIPAAEPPTVADSEVDNIAKHLQHICKHHNHP